MEGKWRERNKRKIEDVSFIWILKGDEKELKVRGLEERILIEFVLHKSFQYWNN